ncbi:hypothetical protein [Methanocella sp. MCL-LM]|uniref:hypothetical protein n=1 Tax=Methanocella sp. MCL-LM TaxID=3412035 RepID=UPI003C7784B2
MENIYPPEIQALDQKYQKDETLQNELALEKAKLNYYREQLKSNPGDSDLQRRITYHESEVARLEAEIKMVG